MKPAQEDYSPWAFSYFPFVADISKRPFYHNILCQEIHLPPIYGVWGIDKCKLFQYNDNRIGRWFK